MTIAPPRQLHRLMHQFANDYDTPVEVCDVIGNELIDVLEIYFPEWPAVVGSPCQVIVTERLIHRDGHDYDGECIANPQSRDRSLTLRARPGARRRHRGPAAP